MSQLEITLAGCTSALAVDALIYPLDTLKTRLQSPTPSPQLFRNLYRGVGPVVLATLPSASVFFLTYESARSALSFAPLPMPAQYFMASTTAEMASCAILTPVEVFKTVTQVSSQSAPSESFFKSIRKVKPAALRQGFVTLAGRNLPFTGIQFPLYEIFRRRIELSTPKKSKTFGAALSASAAGSIGAWLTMPIDVIKTRTMLTTTNETLKETIRRIYVEKGLLGFLRGAGLRAAWAGFGSGVYLGTYETAKLWLKNEL